MLFHKWSEEFLMNVKPTKIPSKPNKRNMSIIPKLFRNLGCKQPQKTLWEGGVEEGNQQWVPHQMLRESPARREPCNKSACVWLTGLGRETPWTSHFPRTWGSDSCLVFHWQAPAKSPEEGIFTSLLMCSWGTSFLSSSLLQQLLGGRRQFTVNLEPHGFLYFDVILLYCYVNSKY